MANNYDGRTRDFEADRDEMGERVARAMMLENRSRRPLIKIGPLGNSPHAYLIVK